MEAYRGSGGTAPLILTLGPRWRSVVNIRHDRCTLGKELPMPVQEEAG